MIRDGKLEFLERIYIIIGLLTICSGIILTFNFGQWYLFWIDWPFPEYIVTPLIFLIAGVLLYMSSINIVRGKKFMRIASVGCILGIISSLSYIFLLGFSRGPTHPIEYLYPLLLIIYLIILCLPFVLIWSDKLNEKQKKLKELHFIEIKQLLKEHKSLTEIKKKIQGWRDDGYNVDELEEKLRSIEE